MREERVVFNCDYCGTSFTKKADGMLPKGWCSVGIDTEQAEDDTYYDPYCGITEDELEEMKNHEIDDAHRITLVDTKVGCKKCITQIRDFIKLLRKKNKYHDKSISYED